MLKKYNVILTDPPWHYRNRGNGHAGNHYPMMKTEEICRLRVRDLAADNCILAMWATWPCMRDAFQVIDAWGFSYVTGFPWIKITKPLRVDFFGDIRNTPTYGTGHWVRGATEAILISTLGDVSPPAGAGNTLGLISERLEHSRKPDSIYDYLEKFEGPYLEMFARRLRYGWDQWGDQAPDAVEIDLGAEKESKADRGEFVQVSAARDIVYEVDNAVSS